MDKACQIIPFLETEQVSWFESSNLKSMAISLLLEVEGMETLKGELIL